MPYEYKGKTYLTTLTEINVDQIANMRSPMELSQQIV